MASPILDRPVTDFIPHRPPFLFVDRVVEHEGDELTAEWDVPEDLFALAEDVILHRIRLSYEAVADGYTSQQVLQEILSEVAK